MRTTRRPHDLVAGADVTFGQHAQVEPRAVVGDQQRRQPRLAHPHADPETGHPRLGDLELRLTDPQPVADADLVVCETFDGEVLPERAALEVVTTEELLPVPVGLDLVDEHGALLPAVPCEVALPVAVDVEAPHHPRPVDRALPHAGVHGAAAPGHVLRHPDVEGQQGRHQAPPRLCPRLVGVILVDPGQSSRGVRDHPPAAHRRAVAAPGSPRRGRSDRGSRRQVVDGRRGGWAGGAGEAGGAGGVPAHPAPARAAAAGRWRG